MSVFDTCISEYPCLKVYVSYVVTATTPTPSSSRNSSSDEEHRRGRRSAAGANSSTSAGGRRLTAETADAAQVHYDRRLGGAGNQPLSRASLHFNNVSLLPDQDSSSVPAAPLASTATSAAASRLDRVMAAGNGSGPMTSETDRSGATNCDFGDLTLTTTADVNRSYVAKLYRSWDDSFLLEVITTTLLSAFASVCVRLSI